MLTRDPEFGYRFLEEQQDKLFFGTDLCHSRNSTEVPRIVRYLRSAAESGKVSAEALTKICRYNAIRVFKLDACHEHV